MAWVFKALIVAISAGVLTLTTEKTVPSISLAIEVCACAVILMLAVSLLGPVLSFVSKLAEVLGASGVVFTPLLKCFGAAVITRIGASLCRDAKQSGAASALEFTGAVAAVWSALPLLEAFLSMLQSLL